MAYLVFPLISLIKVAYINEWAFLGNRGVFASFAWHEWLYYISFPILAASIYSVSTIGYRIFLALSTTVLLYTAVLYFKGGAQSLYLGFIGQMFTLGLVGHFLRTHTLSPYFNPKLQWWKRPQRHFVKLGAQVRVYQSIMECRIMDISSGGCFVNVKRPLNVGDKLWLHLSLDHFHFTVLCKVMWVKKENPTGRGLMFTGMGFTEKMRMKQMIRHLQKSQKTIDATHLSDDRVIAA